jgi:putative inorganic carbon (hco3(-)) transporter
VTALIAVIIGAATLAFGSVYPWAYRPLFVAAACLGAAGLWRSGLRRDLRAPAIALGCLWLVAAGQLLPLPPALLQRISPSTPGVSAAYNLTTSGAADAWIPISIDPPRTQTAVAGLGAFILYLLGAPGLIGARRLRSLPGAIAIVAVPLALFAIYTREHQNGLIYGFWQPIDGGGSDQAGPFVNRNHYAGWILMTLCLMIGALFGHIERASAAAGPRRRWARAVSDSAGAVVLMTTAVLTGVLSLFWVISRSALTAFGMAAVTFACAALTRSRFVGRSRMTALTILALMLVAGIMWRGTDTLMTWFLDERSLLSRLDAWRDGWSVVRAFPAFGTGLNTYSVAMLFYQRRNPGYHMAQAHNDYLQLLAEGGIVIAAVASVAAAFLIRAIARSVGASRHEAMGFWVRLGASIGMLAMAIQEIAEFSLQIPANALLFCTLAVIAMSPARRSAASRSHGARDTINPSMEYAGATLP